MAKGFLSIKDVPQELRSKGAERLRGRLREMLANPIISADQQAALVSKMRDVDAWEAGRSPQATPLLPEEPATPKLALEAPEAAPLRNGLVQLPARTPQHHAVEVVESLKVEES